MRSTIKSDPSDNGPFELWKHNFMSYLFWIIDDNKPNRVILTFDKHSWRYKYFPTYKSKRKIQQLKENIKFDDFYIALSDIKNNIKLTFSTIYTIEINECEGDDIIGTICKNNKEDDIVIASRDSDFNQLLTSKIKRYDPIKRKIVECLIKDGVSVGMSSRALGELVDEGGVNKVTNMRLIAIDCVADPSCPKAFVNGILESKQYVLKTNGELQEFYDNFEKSIAKLPKHDVNSFLKEQILKFIKGL
jgi:5'-3' exonuclease